MQGGDTAKVLAAGLPNVMGNIAGQQSGGVSVWGSAGVGALYVPGGSKTYPALAKAPEGTISRMESGYLHVDANRSNSIYGASTTVQPPAILLIPQIKF